MCTTDEELCRHRKMFCKIKYIVFKVKNRQKKELCCFLKQME